MEAALNALQAALQAALAQGRSETQRLFVPRAMNA
jgi:hypothetical protein